MTEAGEYDRSGKRGKSPKIVVKHSKRVLQRIFKVLYLVVYDNPYACNEMSSMLKELIELLPLSTITKCPIPRLLKEICRSWEPEIEDYERFFENWVG